MRISKKTWRALATAVAVPGSAFGALAGFAAVPAMAGTAQSQMGYPAIETFYEYGAIASDNLGNVPVYASGVFNDQGSLHVTGQGISAITLRHGDIDMTTSGSHFYSHTSQQSCNETDTLTFSYSITGGTLRYAGAHGGGHGSIDVWAVVSRNDDGACTSDPIPNTIRVLVDASGPFTQGS